VREDYSPSGAAWDDFDHDQARFRAYRWNEDGLGGICDEEQRLCLALALWNGRDPILKERPFGLTGNQGNHGEDVKEYYFYLDATPSHSYLRYLFKYPQGEYPYARLVDENRRRSRFDPPFSLLDTGVFEENRYWDVEVVYAKSEPDNIFVRFTAHNRGPEKATLHLLPTLWFRNTWSWKVDSAPKPKMMKFKPPKGSAWAVRAEHPTLGEYFLYGNIAAEQLFTENETNSERLWGIPNQTRYTKDAFHRRIIHGEEAAANPDMEGTKFAAWHILEVDPGASASVDLMLTSHDWMAHLKSPARLMEHMKSFDTVLNERKVEADQFFEQILPDASAEDASILRQSLAGLIWSKQFYHYDIGRWLDGDGLPPPDARKWGRNSKWRHLKSSDVISMPDAWEYPWFAAWDLAFHCAAMALIDVDFAKEQLELLLRERYLHPSGQIPAYEWAFEDVNPPVQAWAALECFRAERALRGQGDLRFLRRMFNKLILNYAWWINRQDPDNRKVFQGGFLGLDNISVYDRSRPLPFGYSLKQADATGWMAMYALNLTVMAIELAAEDPGYEEMAIQIHEQFFAIANAIHGNSESGVSLWDDSDMFFKDVVVGPGGATPLHVFSFVGLIPVFGCEIVGPEQLKNIPSYTAFLKDHAGGFYDGNFVCACPHTENKVGEHLFSLATPADLLFILKRVLNMEEFLSPHGIRSLSRIHGTHPDLGTIPGLGQTMISYEPGESMSGLFGGNSNWRGPVWFPVNFLLIHALNKLHRYLGDNFTVPAQYLDGKEVTLKDAADYISERLIDIFRRDRRGIRPAFPEDSLFQNDPYWKDLILFHEYFHGETGQGLGASHQTGWTALVANLLARTQAVPSATMSREP
jgi:hypothetical protein